jgi:hypothetical protein
LGLFVFEAQDAGAAAATMVLEVGQAKGLSFAQVW